MSSAENFHPVWGYLAPAPSFLRTVRIVLVATALGATAGAAVVLSLVEHPAAEGGNTSVAARTMVGPVDASLAVVSSKTKASAAQPQKQPQDQAPVQAQTAAPTLPAAPAVAPGTSAPAETEELRAQVLDGAMRKAGVVPAPKKARKKHHIARPKAPHTEQAYGWDTR